MCSNFFFTFQEYQERDEDQSRTMERILILARNVLQVPADPDIEKRPDNDASVHDQVSSHSLKVTEQFFTSFIILGCIKQACTTTFFTIVAISLFYIIQYLLHIS